MARRSRRQEELSDLLGDVPFKRRQALLERIYARLAEGVDASEAIQSPRGKLEAMVAAGRVIKDLEVAATETVKREDIKHRLAHFLTGGAIGQNAPAVTIVIKEAKLDDNGND